MSTADSTPVFDAAADAYDTHLVPAFFDEWAAFVTGLMGTPPPDGTVLDVGCGTGVLAPHLAAAGWPTIVGVDPSSGMLARARARGVAGAQWLEGTAESIPREWLPAHALASNFALMFMPDPAAAVRAMAQAVREGGPVVVCTWGSVQAIPGMGAICDALQDAGGDEASALLRRAFSMGRRDILERVAADSGVPGAEVGEHRVTARFPGVATLAEAYAGPLGLGDPARAPELEVALGAHLTPFIRDGAVEFMMTGLFISCDGMAVA